MDYADRLKISYYNTIATINSAHKIYLVQHREPEKYTSKKYWMYTIPIYTNI